ncbi:response regulator transcription factor [Parafrankia sp. EUN1f]|uniref:response regulator transcription factor n=1 Tax=Parafrankia sp. EUN1f TaxID=102897 RepID=UPI0001C44A25|nr:response regulator transcription factor [Parafrankia sp. EUN1f]EFC85048.1 transcriptional regulator, LuxR family [Parafrankia sp. EUN1f]
MPHRIRVLLRASDPITQAGLAAQLGGCPEIEIVERLPGAVAVGAGGAEPAVAVAGAVTVAAGGGVAGARGAAAVAAGVAAAAAGGGGSGGAGAAGRPSYLRPVQPTGEPDRGRGRDATPGRSAHDGASAAGLNLSAAEPGAADVVLVSAENADERTLRTVRELQQGGVPVVLVVAELEAHDLTAAVEAGVVGLLRRATATPEAVLAAVRGAAVGEGYLPPDMLGSLLRQVQQVSTQVLAPRGLTFSGLSERELTVLRLVAEGHDTQEIGRRLNYSERTVKNVLQDVTRRFGLRNRSHAVAFALRQGLL